MPTLSATSALLNSILGCFPPTFFGNVATFYETQLKSKNNGVLIKKMKLVHNLAYTTDTISQKLSTKDTCVIAHIIKLMALITYTDKSDTNTICCEALERAEADPNMKEGSYLRLCDRVKNMKAFYDFIMPLSKRNDFLVEIENDEEGEWIRVSYLELNI